MQNKLKKIEKKTFSSVGITKKPARPEKWEMVDIILKDLRLFLKVQN